MMALRQWRKFSFFDVAQDVDGGNLKEGLQSARVTCAASGRGCLVLGDSSGRVHFVSRQLEVVSHTVYDGALSQLEQLKNGPVIAAAGVDELGVSSVKILSLEQLDGGGSPRLLRELKLPPATAEGGAAVTCLCVHENLLFMAVGLDNGSVVLWRGDVTRERSVKQQVLHDGGAPITGLGFRTIGKTSHLFLASTDDVVCYNITFRDKENQIRLDKSGCAAGCAVMSDGLSEPQFTVGRPDAIYCYSANERGACFVFEGQKQLLHWFKGYLTVVDVEPAAAAAEASAAGRHTITIYDVNNKYVALTAQLRHVAHVVADWGQLHVVTSDGKLHRLTERDTQSKLQVLFKKNLYDMAIRLAQSQQYDADGLVEIFRQYGDHLHSKGDFTGAVQQYVKTIGKLEPSYVIRKYLDTQRIRDLTLYLQALHAAGRASEDHTTLLINCYTKLRDTQQLDKFIQGEDGAVVYDVDTAVRVCRSSGYHEQALAMARRHGQTDRVIAIMTEDLSDPGRALRYISELPHAQCEEAILKHGAQLLKEKPDDTVELLKKLCVQDGEEGAGAAVPIEQYLDLFVAQPAPQARFLQHLMETRPEALHSDALLALLEAYLTCPDPAPDCSPGKSAFAAVPQAPDRPARLPPGSSASAAPLTEPGPEAAGSEGPSPARVEAALRLLESERLNLPLALHLCQTHGFQQGTAKLYERAGMHSQILQTQLSAGDYAAALETCRRYGEQRPQLWLEALRALCSDLDGPADVIRTVLDVIEQGNVAPAMEVLDILVESPRLELGTIRDYMTRVLSAEQQDIDRDTEEADRLAEEVRTTLQQIRDDETSGVVFQRTTCAACNQPLDLPSLHFFCGHSYHQHCFQSYTDADENCPICLAEHSQLQADGLSQAESAELEARFFEELGESEDMFSVIADYVGKGAFALERPTEKSETAEASAPSYGMSEYLRSTGATESVGAAAEARLRVTDRVAGSGVLAGDSEARVRTGEQRSQPVQPVPEARLRAAQASQVTSTVPEGRLRAAQTSQVTSTVPEGRLRAAQTSQVTSTVPEGRLRAAQASQVASSTAEGRLRAAQPSQTVASVAEARLRAGEPSHVGGGPTEGRVRATVQRPTPTPPPQPSEARHRLQEGGARTKASEQRAEMAAPAAGRHAAPNPFEDGPNPFDDDASNPFLDEEDANNPFAEDAGEYDKSLNPFEE